MPQGGVAVSRLAPQKPNSTRYVVKSVATFIVALLLVSETRKCWCLYSICSLTATGKVSSIRRQTEFHLELAADDEPKSSFANLFLYFLLNTI